MNRGPSQLRRLVLAALLFAPAGAAAELQPFTADSFATIKERHDGRPFLVVLWSLECPPCYKELALLGRWRKNGGELPLVLISTDPVDRRDAARQTLARFELGDAPAWIFADTFVERLRHSIDPQWRGELPRSYFYDAGHRRTAHSGVLDKAQLQQWADRTGP